MSPSLRSRHRTGVQHEAEWLLDLLERLFDFYILQSARSQSRRDALNAKLQEVGKPPMKKP
jgi:hypothetical protein